MPSTTNKPRLTQAGLQPSHAVIAVDEHGEARAMEVAGESALTLYVDRQEIVTLMTLGTHPEALSLGYLRNQGFVRDIADIASVQVDWEVASSAVKTRSGIKGLSEKLASRTVTTGCGQGTVFGKLMDDLENIHLPPTRIAQSTIYHLLDTLATYNDVYRKAGAVHGCALCSASEVLMFVEDVGRHNAVDTIAGMMWLDDLNGNEKIFYTTGRLTSEMVIKVAQMGISVLLSRSGVTEMGLSLAKKMGVILIARAKGRHFLVFNGDERIDRDATPQPKVESHSAR